MRNHLYVHKSQFLIAHLCIFAKDMLLELARREKNAGIKPDEDIDIFMKVSEMGCQYYLDYYVFNPINHYG